jgi:geranylgeranyl diphosphate synthase type II
LSYKYNTYNCHIVLTTRGGLLMQDPLLDCEEDIREFLAEHTTSQCPPMLAQAMEYAVFPGGARVRPQLCMAVALANNSSDRPLAAAAAAAVEFLHCASLVHDDLPCFDDALERRGKPSVHAKFGERIAVLAGDALIVAAFQTLAVHAIHHVRAERVPLILSILARGVGAPHGIAAGQAWECEPSVDVSRYHRAKTGALFIAATCAGAAAAGVDPGPWVNLGACIGEAFQVADDIKDAVGDPETIGKAVGIDAKLGRPNAVHELGLDGATDRLKTLLEEGLDSVPHCTGRDNLVRLVRAQSARFVPEKMGRTAA